MGLHLTPGQWGPRGPATHPNPHGPQPSPPHYVYNHPSPGLAVLYRPALPSVRPPSVCSIVDSYFVSSTRLCHCSAYVRGTCHSSFVSCPLCHVTGRASGFVTPGSPKTPRTRGPPPFTPFDTLSTPSHLGIPISWLSSAPFLRYHIGPAWLQRGKIQGGN